MSDITCTCHNIAIASGGTAVCGLSIGAYLIAMPYSRIKRYERCQSDQI